MRAIIVGSEGQDGRLLGDALRRDGGTVLGIGRGGRPDILRRGEVLRAVRRFKPREIYYLAAWHHSSQDRPPEPVELFERSWRVHFQGLLHFLDAMRLAARKARLFYASSSLVFGEPASRRQSERTPVAPACAYGVTKEAGMAVCRHYRREHGLFAVSGILYNHESPLRDERFLSRKIVRAAVEIRRGRRRPLVLGDLDAAVDWGWAPDYVEAMRRMLRLKRPEDLVIATGRARTVRDFARRAFARLGLDWRDHVRVDPRLLSRRRPPMEGDAARLRRLTGWRPTVTFEGMVDRLVDAEAAR